MGGPWLLLSWKKAARRSSEGLTLGQNTLKYKFADVVAKSCTCFASGGVRASGEDAAHGGHPAETAAWSGTLHCSSSRLHRSGPGEHTWKPAAQLVVKLMLNSVVYLPRRALIISPAQVAGAVDGNVIRVLCRLRAIGADCTSPAVTEALWWDLNSR